MTQLFRPHYQSSALRKKGNKFILWASELSPFALKIESLLQFAGQPYQFLPAEGNRWQNFSIYAQLELAKRDKKAVRFPHDSELDEYPLVPYLLIDEKVFYYDSTGIAQWLDHQGLTGEQPVYGQDQAIAFLVLLIEEAFDEFGLYMVHHNRWVNSVNSNTAEQRLSKEFGKMLPGVISYAIGRRFAPRQVSRLPYLFSCADKSIRYSTKKHQPPALDGFPETHSLLDHAFVQYLDSIEAILKRQPYIFGNSFTAADAAIYGQLGMNLSDPEAEKIIANRAPLTYRWLYRIAKGKHNHEPTSVDHWLDDALKPLLSIIDKTFIHLMLQNEKAFEANRGLPLDSSFNESGFNRGLALYNGELMGSPFRSVAKTFQVRVLTDLQKAWRSLLPEDKEILAPLVNHLEFFHQAFSPSSSHTT